jgi:predicted nucleotide-binding protein (sugar kinase/HSP70/actin superfamily)
MPVTRKTHTYKQARASVKKLKQESRNIQTQAKQNAKRLEKIVETVKNK